NYRISFSVGLALRYLPEVTSTFVHIMHAQMARGVDISKNVKLSKRIKNVSRVLGPLVLSSMDRIDIITQALILRGFCREPKRTWYKKKPLKFTDWLIIIVLFLWVGISFVSRFYFKVKFWYPFN
ncbi:MAG: energy-coupling factor transporter transmembrane component T, partial [Sphaerochaetaceae bacterium]